MLGLVGGVGHVVATHAIKPRPGIYAKFPGSNFRGRTRGEVRAAQGGEPGSVMRDGIIAAVGGASVRPVRGPWGVLWHARHNGPPGSPMATCGQILPGCTNPEPPYGT